MRSFSNNGRSGILVAFTACTLCLTASGAAAQESAFAFPAHPTNWLNSPPVSAEALRGKGVVLYFFEES